ncbi:hypothetical protein WOLCODRAFT_92409 [Wolfiporia cocos MD-104 SS10]|uniref:DNA helicase n=1 Tax=Wolfiporia cocos (strain MD-104) TaxID=742152 RepID=A0A2H3J6H0_WOLCO|nr:hypothetical protein WOLCODRAFT_92409 [Wolfiporia cocos MD-104 SS10]
MASENELRAFIARHRVLLDREREAEVERSSLLLSNCGPKLLEQKGLALGGLGIASVNIGLGGKTIVELERPAAYHTTPIFPPHTLRPGDLARIEENVSEGPARKKATAKSKKAEATGITQSRSAEGVVYKVSDVRIVIAIDAKEASSDELDLPERCRLVKLANSVTYDRMDKTLDLLEKVVLPNSVTSNDKNIPTLTPLIRVLMGMAAPSARVPVEGLTFFDESLNPSQREAVKFALESPEVACIHGPPGTGKTHTLIEIIRQLSTVTPSNPKPLRLLICGASNLSVDNILERLLALPPPASGEKLKVTRVGHPARVMAHEGVLDSTLEAKASRSDQALLAKDVKNELEAALDLLSGKGKGAKVKPLRGADRKKMWEEVRALRKEYRQREGGVIETVLGESQVVLATCYSSGGRQLKNHQFDAVIIDEATQAMEAVCWIPIFKAKKLILAGDPMQLPPTILSEDDRKKKRSDAKLKSAPSKAKTGQKPPIARQSKREKATAAPPPDVAANVDEEPGPPSSSDSDDSDGSDSDAESGEDERTEIGKGESPQPFKTRSTEKGKPKRDMRKKQGLRPPRSLETTLFDRLEKMYGPRIKRMLNVQYRMHAEIAAFPSKAMYQNKLMSHPSVAAHLLRDLPNAKASSEDEEKELLTTPVAFFDTAGCEYYERTEGDGDEGSRCNENEATIVKNYVDQLASVGILASQIAIVTPYQAQVTLLSSLLRPVYGLDLEIGSVDGMQGREKEVIVMSLVRSNDKREVGFLKDKRRLNVAMTRAKMHLCVVGDSSTLKHGGKFLKSWMTWLETHADVRYAGLE